MPALTSTMFLKVICVLFLLVFIHTAAALGTAMFHSIFFLDTEYENYTVDYYVERSVATIAAGASTASAIWVVFLLGDVSRFRDMLARFCGSDTDKMAPTRRDASFAILSVFTVTTVASTYLSLGWWGTIRVDHVVIWVLVPCMAALGLVWLVKRRTCSRLT
ncbi:MAG: hypothetical protein EB829_00870 [Nitrosopumilus sp. H8]|nr:MAG: hypothetical protein EB829_00870 [Nitrosopumilus sp. H8]